MVLAEIFPWCSDPEHGQPGPDSGLPSLVARGQPTGITKSGLPSCAANGFFRDVLMARKCDSL